MRLKRRKDLSRLGYLIEPILEPVTISDDVKIVNGQANCTSEEIYDD